MDGSNRTLIDVGQHYIVAFTLDRKTQVLYWVNYDYHILTVKSSNIDGTSRQTIVQQIPHYYSTLSLHENMLYLSSWVNEVYKFSTGGENFTTVINSSVHCNTNRNYHDLKIVSEEQQPQSKTNLVVIAINLYLSPCSLLPEAVHYMQADGRGGGY